MIYMQTSITAYLVLVFCLAYFSSLKQKAICSSKNSVDIHLTSSRYIAENKSHLCR
jgi:hypothetical protein